MDLFNFFRTYSFEILGGFQCRLAVPSLFKHFRKVERTPRYTFCCEADGFLKKKLGIESFNII